MIDDRGPMQRYDQTQRRVPSPRELRNRCRAFLLGWLLLPWGFLAVALSSESTALIWIVPPFALTAAGMICVKYVFPAELVAEEKHSTADEVRAAASFLQWDSERWIWVMRGSITTVAVAFMILIVAAGA